MAIDERAPTSVLGVINDVCDETRERISAEVKLLLTDRIEALYEDRALARRTDEGAAIVRFCGTHEIPLGLVEAIHGETAPVCLHVKAEDVEIGAWVYRMDLDDEHPDHGSFTQLAHRNEWGSEDMVKVELVLVGGEILTRFPGDLVAVAMSDEAAQAWNQPSDPTDAF